MAFKLNLKSNAPMVNLKPKTESKRDLLFGTGLTKKLAQQETKQQAKQVFAPIALADTLATELESQTQIDVATLPTNLMPDDLVLDEFQGPAVQGMVNEKYACLIGAAGTGKTTTVKAFVKAIQEQVVQIHTQTLHTLAGNEKNANDKSTLPAIAFCAPTGKAAQQLKRALPKQLHPLVSTIHKMLGFEPVEEEREDLDENGKSFTRIIRVFRPTYTATNKLPYKIIIMDEGGNVPVSLWHLILDAITDDCRIFIIGDLNQLPPVNGHSILGFAMLSWPTFVLERLHRQAEGDPIAENAHRILAGKKPLPDVQTNRFFVKYIEGGSSVLKLQTLGIIRHMHENGRFNPLRDVLIVPQNQSDVGQIELNNVLVRYFNPVKKDENGKSINPRVIIVCGWERKIFGVGDKVMLLKNDNELGLTNGMMGLVTEISANADYKGEHIVYANDSALANQELNIQDLADITELAEDVEQEDDDEEAAKRQASHIMKVRFQNVDDEVTFKTTGGFSNLAFGYAITCHKSQGSEYENVVVMAHSVNQRMLCREWLYTAVTRARKSVVILTNNRGLTYAVNNQKIRGATIAEKAKKFIALAKAAKDEPAARLPPAERIVDVKLTINRGAK